MLVPCRRTTARFNCENGVLWFNPDSFEKVCLGLIKLVGGGGDRAGNIMIGRRFFAGWIHGFERIAGGGVIAHHHGRLRQGEPVVERTRIEFDHAAAPDKGAGRTGGSGKRCHHPRGIKILRVRAKHFLHTEQCVARVRLCQECVRECHQMIAFPYAISAITCVAGQQDRDAAQD